MAGGQVTVAEVLRQTSGTLASVQTEGRIDFCWEKTQPRHKRRFEHELAKFTATPIVA